MYPALPEQFILMTVAAFLIGWLLSSLSSSIGAKQRVQRRDPRDDRIRSLEAEYRIAQTGLPALLWFLGKLTRKVPKQWINIPNKEFWYRTDTRQRHRNPHRPRIRTIRLKSRPLIDDAGCGGVDIGGTVVIGHGERHRP